MADIPTYRFDRRIVSAESNSIRVVAIFDILTILSLIILTLLFNISNRSTRLVWFSILHLVLPFIAAFVSTIASIYAKYTYAIFAAQTVFDAIELVLRIVPLTTGSFLEFRTIGELVFIFLNILLLIYDVLYLLFIYRYITVYDAVLDDLQREGYNTGKNTDDETVGGDGPFRTKDDSGGDFGMPSSSKQTSTKPIYGGGGASASTNMAAFDALRVDDGSGLRQRHSVQNN
jgi:hypothetical protein